MKRPWKLALAGVAIIALAAAMGRFATDPGPLAPVAVRLAAASEIEQSVSGIGTVEARHACAIGPTQAGRVLRLHVDHGDAVRPGQLLGEMDPVDLEQRLSAARSAPERAQQGVLSRTRTMSERLHNAAETRAPGRVQKEAPGLAHMH